MQILHKEYNLLWKFFHKISFSKFSSHFDGIFFQNSKFSKLLIYNLQNFYHSLVSNTQNENYMKFWYVQTKQQAFKVAVGGFCPPGSFRVIVFIFLFHTIMILYISLISSKSLFQLFVRMYVCTSVHADISPNQEMLLISVVTYASVEKDQYGYLHNVTFWKLHSSFLTMRT